jgi:cytochrome d ubiquinol oxidase subunit II
MTPVISHLFLQQYWWIIISILAAALVVLMFVQGGQTMLFSLPSNDDHRKMIVNALGQKWEITFTTLVTFGGALFASFPLFYATSFGGAYWTWMLILFSFIIQTVAYEYRSKPSNILGRKTFDIFLYLNGSFGPFLLGVAAATFFTGASFHLNEMNRVTWDSQWLGLEALFSIRNLSLGIALLFVAKVNGLIYLIYAIDSEEIVKKARGKLMINSIVFLISFLFFIISLLLSDGMAAGSDGSAYLEKYKYLKNFIQMPFVMIQLIAGIILVLTGLWISVFRSGKYAIWIMFPGVFLTVFSFFLAAGFNGTSFYPSLTDPQSSLTINNASSSYFTLKTMMYVSFATPVIILYIWYAWSQITGKKISQGEVASGDHVY